MEHKHINLSYLRLMSGGSADAEVEMLELLLNDVSTLLPKLQAAIDKKQWEEIKRISHHLKSSFAFAGNDPLIRAIKALEQEAISRNAYGDMARLWQTIQQETPAVRTELKQALSNLKSQN